LQGLPHERRWRGGEAALTDCRNWMEITMTQATMEATREQLLKDFNKVVVDTEELLKSAGAAGGEKAMAWRAGVEQNLKAAKEKLIELEEAAVARTKAVAHATDEYVHENPWQSVGISAGIGLAAGLVIGLLLNRR
jgi:ElaB/YqjD/DUF883 family membrane-anchored ribosome-binding protein